MKRCVWAVLTRTMNGVLNEVTNTVHERETGGPTFQTVCGATYHVSHDDLRIVAAAGPELDTTNASRCDRCFDDAGGY